MATRIGELLLDTGLVSKDQLDEGLQVQMIFGGRLGTNLVELGYLNDAALASLLSAQLRIPCAQTTEFIGIPEAVLKAVPGEVADHYKVFPLKLEGPRLRLAMAAPTNLHAIDEIAFLTGLHVEPVVAPEIVIVYAVEKYYGIHRSGRYVRVPPELARQFGIHAEADPAEKALLDIPSRQLTLSQPPWSPKPMGAVVPEGVHGIYEALLEATDPRAVLELLRRHLVLEFQRVALFTIRDQSACGWAQVGCELSDEEFLQMSIPVDTGHLIKSALAQGELFVGTLPREAVDNAFLARLGIPEGAEIFAAPLVVRGQITAIAVGNSPRTPRGLSSVNLWRQIFRRAGMAVEAADLRAKILSSEPV